MLFVAANMLYSSHGLQFYFTAHLSRPAAALAGRCSSGMAPIVGTAAGREARYLN